MTSTKVFVCSFEYFREPLDRPVSTLKIAKNTPPLFLSLSFSLGMNLGVLKIIRIIFFILFHFISMVH